MHKIELIGKQINVWTGGKSKLNYLGVCDYLKVARWSCLYSHHVKLPVIIRGECKGRLHTEHSSPYLPSNIYFSQQNIDISNICQPPVRERERKREEGRDSQNVVPEYFSLFDTL